MTGKAHEFEWAFPNPPSNFFTPRLMPICGVGRESFPDNNAVFKKTILLICLGLVCPLFAGPAGARYSPPAIEYSAASQLPNAGLIGDGAYPGANLASFASSSLIPFGLSWGDSPARARKLLQKQTTNVHKGKDDRFPPDMELMDAVKYYGGHPFTVRCVFEKGKLGIIALNAVLVAYKNNGKRASALLRKFFLDRFNKECALIKVTPYEGGEMRFYKSGKANVRTVHTPFAGNKGSRLTIIYHNLSRKDEIFHEGAIFSAQR